MRNKAKVFIISLVLVITTAAICVSSCMSSAGFTDPDDTATTFFDPTTFPPTTLNTGKIYALLGDVNWDGKVLADDARFTLRMSARLETLYPWALAVADVNGDGVVLSDDARQILRYSAKLQSGFERVVPVQIPIEPTTVTLTAVVAPATVAPTTVARTTTTAAPATEPKSTVMLSINCATILGQMDRLRDGKEPFVPTDGVILPEIPVDIKQGDTAFDVLKKACGTYDIQLEYTAQNMFNTVYVEGINQLYEKDCGSNSGWIYKVNGVQPHTDRICIS